MATKTFVRDELKFFSENPYHLLGLSCVASNDAILSAYMRLQKLINFNAVENYSRVISIDRLSLPKYSLEMLSKVYTATNTMESKVFAFSSIKYTAPLTMIRVSTLLETTTTYDAFLGCYLWLLENDISFIHMDMWEFLCKRIDEMIETPAVKWKEVFDNRLSQNDIADNKDCYEEFHEAFCNIILNPLKKIVPNSDNMISAMEIYEAIKKQKSTTVDTSSKKSSKEEPINNEKEKNQSVSEVAPVTGNAEPESLIKDIKPEKAKIIRPTEIKEIKANDTSVLKESVVQNNPVIDEIKPTNTSNLKSFEVKNQPVIDAVKPTATKELKEFVVKNEPVIDAIKPTATKELKYFVVKNEAVIDSISADNTKELKASKIISSPQLDEAFAAEIPQEDNIAFISDTKVTPVIESDSIDTKPKASVSDTDNEILKLLGHIKSSKGNATATTIAENISPIPVVKAIKPETIEPQDQVVTPKISPEDEIKNLLRQIEGTKEDIKKDTTIILSEIMDNEPVDEEIIIEEIIEPEDTPEETVQPEQVFKQTEHIVAPAFKADPDDEMQKLLKEIEGKSEEEKQVDNIVQPVIIPPQPVVEEIIEPEIIQEEIIEPEIIQEEIIQPEPVQDEPIAEKVPELKAEPDDEMQRLLKQIETGKVEPPPKPVHKTIILGPEILENEIKHEEPDPVPAPSIEPDDSIQRLLKLIEEDGERYFSADGHNPYYERYGVDKHSEDIVMENQYNDEENSGKISLLDGVNVSDNIYAKITQEGRNNKCIMDGLAIVETDVTVKAAEKINSDYKMDAVEMIPTEKLVSPTQSKAKQMDGILTDQNGIREVRGEDNGYRMNGTPMFINNDTNIKAYENMSYQRRSQKKTSKLISLLFWLLLLLGAGGAALYYFVL